jgi:putative component of membrane protein insertase Oxa1/YidC/SpoIIIJ protein YidD
MLLSIEKYGVWKGLPKGVNRLRRCNINNGGFDEP